MSKIAVCGVSGRMGQRLAHLTLEAEDLELSVAPSAQDMRRLVPT